MSNARVSSARGEKHSVAGVVLYQDGRVLMQHRDNKPDIASPGLWSIFGGSLDPGENPETGAVRELEEELELKLTGRLSLIYRSESDTRVIHFFAHPLDAPIESLPLHEGQDMRLLDRVDIRTYPLVPFHRKLVLEFLLSRGDML